MSLLTYPLLRAAEPATRSALDGSPTIVTITATDASVQELFEMLAMQTGAVFAPVMPEEWQQPAYQQRLNVNYQELPFWAVVSRIQELSGVRVGHSVRSNDDPAVIVLRLGGKPPPVSVDGAFLFLARGITRSASKVFASTRPARPGDDVQVSLEVLTDPKFRQYVRSGSLRLTRAVDENGVSLLPEVPASRPVTSPTPHHFGGR